MKNQMVKVATVLFLGLAVVSCKKAKNETEATAAEDVQQLALAAERYVADLEGSTITWKGSKTAKSHNGTIGVSEGYVAFEGDQLTGGNFIIDMNSIVNLDLENEEYNTKLVNHLKSADFFEVEKHPYSVFAITSVDKKDNGKTMVKGNLTVKGIKKNIEFPATVTVNGDEVSFVSEPFTIDRTEWDVKYNSGKFFEDLKDKLINDEIEISFNIKAKKDQAI
ncbi:MAG: YceI family protein [Flavobacteriaceae bacterium]|nr:YceI family protein [Flavobacteriaceae bacterium]